MRAIQVREKQKHVRRRHRSYTVKFTDPEKGRQKETFEQLPIARKFALTKLGQDVELTNKNGMVLPL